MPTPHRPWIELKVILERDGMSLSELSRITGLSIGYVGDLARGRRQGSSKTRRKIADALRVPLSMLMPPAPEDEDLRWTKWRDWPTGEDDSSEDEEAA